MISIYIICLLGFLLSSYAAYVEHKSKKNKHYHALCDINDRLSCTKAFGSEYGKIFGFSNGLSGVLFYSFVFLVAFFGYVNYVFYFAIISILMSAYLWYNLTFKVKTFCVICYSIYAVNIALLIVSYF